MLVILRAHKTMHFFSYVLLIPGIFDIVQVLTSLSSTKFVKFALFLQPAIWNPAFII